MFKITNIKIKGKSKTTGAFEILSMVDGDYEVTISAKGFANIVDTVTVEAGVPTTKNYDFV